MLRHYLQEEQRTWEIGVRAGQRSPVLRLPGSLMFAV